jgi:hypothetical protein
MQINGTVPGGQYDQINVIMTVDLGGASLHVTGTVLAAPNQPIVLVNNDGIDAVVGQFAGLAEGDTVTINGLAFRVSYVGGPGNDEVIGWAQLMVGGLSEKNVVVAFLTSPEYNLGKDNTAFVNSLYQTLLFRSPEAGALNYWVQDLAGGQSREQVVRSFLRSQEYANSLVNDLYGAYLNRTPGTGEAAYWTQELTAGILSDANLGLNLLISQEFLNKTRV